MIKYIPGVLSARFQGLGCKNQGLRVLLLRNRVFFLQSGQPKGFRVLSDVRSQIESHDYIWWAGAWTRTPDRWGSGRGETLTRGAHGTATR